MENTKYVKKQENGNILLIPCELLEINKNNGNNITPVTLSRMGFAIRRFFDFLAGTKELDEYVNEGNKYRVFRDSGNVYLEETRDNIVSIVGFSSGEIPKVLEELKEM